MQRMFWSTPRFSTLDFFQANHYITEAQFDPPDHHLPNLYIICMDFNHRHIITLIVCYIFVKSMLNVLSVALICLHIVYDFVESNGRFILLPPCSQMVDGSQHQQLVAVFLLSFSHCIACPSSISGF